MPLLHDAFADAEEAGGGAEQAGEGLDLVGGGEVGSGDDFEQGCSGAVEVDDGMIDGDAAGKFVEEFAGVFFQMGAFDADGVV